MKIALSFSDVLLVPQYSDITSRKDVDTTTKISKHLSLKIPVISSCMDTVTGPKMASAMWNLGGLGILHRYNTIEVQSELYLDVHNSGAQCAIAVGINGDYQERVRTMVALGARIFCFDVAHGDCKMTIDAIQWFRSNIGFDYTVIAGNVASGSACARLIDAGADAIRLGIGSGGACTTQIITGCGKPTFQTILDCNNYLRELGYSDYCLIADGGIKTSGDIVKSLAAGASAVILGQLLSATDEAPGEVIETHHGKFKKYRGMSSFGAQADWRPDKKNDIVAEGDEAILPYKGSVDKILYQLIGGLRSGMTYNGAQTLQDLKNAPEFIQITSTGLTESHPHAKARV